VTLWAGWVDHIGVVGQGAGRVGNVSVAGRIRALGTTVLGPFRGAVGTESHLTAKGSCICISIRRDGEGV